MKKLIPLLLLLVALVAGLTLVTKVQDLKRGAAFLGNAQVSYLPTDRTVNAGDQFTVKMVVNTPTKSIGFVDLKTKYDPSKLDVVSVTPITSGTYSDANGNVLFGSAGDVLINNIDRTAGTIRISGISMGSTAMGVIQIANITFQAKASGTGTITLDPAYVYSNSNFAYKNGTLMQITANDDQAGPGRDSDLQIAVTPATYTVSGGTVNPTATSVPVNPSATSVPVNPTATGVQTNPTNTPRPTATPGSGGTTTEIPVQLNMNRRSGDTNAYMVRVFVNSSSQPCSTWTVFGGTQIVPCGGVPTMGSSTISAEAYLLVNNSQVSNTPAATASTTYSGGGSAVLNLTWGGGSVPTSTSTPRPMATNTPRPAATNTPVPNPTGSTGMCLVCGSGLASKSTGNAHSGSPLACDAVVNIMDFEVWRREAFDLGGLSGATKSNWSADFNCDQKVNLVDFEIWRSTYFK